MTLYEIAINIITQENSIIEDWLKFKIENPKEANKTVCYVEAPKDINKLQILDAWLEQIEKSKKDIRNFYKKVVTKENKLLKELLIRKQQISILKKALPYYNTKVLCNAGRITEEEQEILLKYEE